MSLDDSELENELASLPASRETRWEQIYVDGDTKLVQRGGGDIGVHDFATQEPKAICITTPPGEMENSFMTNKSTEDAPLSFSSLMPIEPHFAQSNLLDPCDEDHRGVDSKASFSDRVHQLAQAQSQHPSPESSPKRNRHIIPDSTILADLEHEVDLSSSVSTSTAPSRVGTGFSIFDLPDRARRTDTGFSVASGYRMPLHQDSGFGEPERVSYESERIRKSLDESIRDLNYSHNEDDFIKERLWDDNNGTLFGEPVRGRDMHVRPFSRSMPMINLPDTTFGATDLLSTTKADAKALEEKNSNTTIRPPSIQIPEFHHGKVTNTHNNQPPTPPKSGALQQDYTATTNTTGPEPSSYAHAYLSPVRTLSPDMRNYGASSDLSDYLDHEIAFDHDEASYRKPSSRRR
jgi:hypothetical protein